MARIMRLCGLLAGLGCLLKSSWAPVTAFQQSVPFQTTFKTKHCSFARFPPNGSSQDVDDDDRHPSSRGPDAEAILETIVPLLSPILAYLTYDFIAAGFSDVLEALANNNWESADGGAYKAKIIGPTINGIVVPAMAVLFATLTSNTISNLRLRQVDVNLAINMEASELRALECLVSAFPKGSTQDRCRSYLIHYATRIIAESQPGLSPDGANQRKGMDSEMNRFSQEIYQTYDKLPSHLANEAVGAITRLREQRQNRVTALQSTYPSLHYGILMALAMGECMGFLMEANQELLVFLNAVELRILWSLLVGTFVACFTVFYDLRSPFGGSYQISASVDQLYNIRSALKDAVSMSIHEQQVEPIALPRTDMHVAPTSNNRTRV